MSVWCLKVASKDVRYVASLVKEAVMAEGSRTERLMRRLQELQMNTPDVEATSMVSVDGLTMASILPSGVEEDRVAAMSAAMLSLGERIASELGRGMLDEVYVKGERGYVVLRSAGEEAVLTVLARQQAKLGLLFLDMRRASDDLATILGA
jgi:predicted regulator of Ras-like GTPase activity (Roadblock/LC7/MglB family)